MGFWVYEDAITNHATVHEAGCGFCNDGKGTRRANKADVSMKWNGPFELLNSAVEFASSLNRNVKVHTCCGASRSESASQGFKKFQIEDLDESAMSLEEIFHRRMLQIYVRLRDETGYVAIRFLGAVRRHGGVEYAKQALRRPVNMQGGFHMLREEGRLDMSMEHFVSQPEFSALFTEREIMEARRRLSS
jgi:hypothetical protein